MDPRHPDPSDSATFYSPEADFSPADLDNQVVRELEEIAEREIETNAPTFGEWCCESGKDSADFSVLASLAYEHYQYQYKRGTQFSDYVRRLRKDYTDYRVELSRASSEWDDIAARVREEACDE